MDVKKLTIGILTTLIAVVLVSSMLIPAIESSSSTTTVEKQNEGYLYTMTDQIGDYTYTAVKQDLYLNGEVVLSTDGTKFSGGVSTSSLGVAVQKINSANYISTTEQSNELVKSVSITSNGSWTITPITGSTVTGTVDTDNVMFFAAKEGNFAAYNNGASFSVTKGDAIYFMDSIGASYTDSNYYLFCISIIDGVATTVYANKAPFSGGSFSPVVPEVSCAYDSMVTENGVTSYTNLSVNVSFGDITLETLSGNYFAVPLAYTETVTESGPEYTLINIIPLLVLVGVMLGAVGLFISRRD